MFYLFYFFGGIAVGLLLWSFTEGNNKYKFTRVQTGAIGGVSALLLGLLAHANLYLALGGSVLALIAAYMIAGRRQLRH